MCSPDIDSRSKRSSLAAGAAGSEPPQIICDMRLQPPERLVLDEEADGFEGVVGSTGKLVDGRDRHIQPADETIERGFELFQGKAEVRQFATMGLREVPFSILRLRIDSRNLALDPGEPRLQCRMGAIQRRTSISRPAVSSSRAAAALSKSTADASASSGTAMGLNLSGSSARLSLPFTGPRAALAEPSVASA